MFRRDTGPFSAGGLPWGLIAAGVVEIALFGIPLMIAGPLIGRFVLHFDPHIYKEYGVARVVLGVAFFLGAGRPAARRTVAQVGLLFYGLNMIVSGADMVMGNVVRWAEAPVVALSLVLAVACAPHALGRRG